MSEFIVIQVGQCGNQIGSMFWPLVLEEYGIKLQTSSGASNKNSVNQSVSDKKFHSFFSCSKNLTDTITSIADLKENKITARAVLIDMEDSVVSRFKTGPLRDLFEDKCFISNYPGSGNNWAMGHIHHMHDYRDKIYSTVQKIVERCDNLHGFLVFFSMGGGTGSGLGTAVLKLLHECFPCVERFVCPVYPSGTEDVVTAPYNMTLATHQLTEYSSCVFPVENRALSDIVNMQKLHSQCSIDRQSKPFDDMNSILVNMLLHLTSGSRFSGSLNMDMSDIYTNMVPFPKMQYLCSSYSPLTVAPVKIIKQISSKIVQDELFNGICSRSSQLVKIDPLGVNSVLLAATLTGRGILTMNHMRQHVDRLRKHANFAPWNNCSIKVSLCNVPSSTHDAAMLALYNSSSMHTLFKNILEQLDLLYKRKAHVHHYLEVDGFEECFITDARDSLLKSLNDYKRIEQVQPTVFPRLNVI